MSSEKSDAIVLRITEFSETSCVVTLYTREFGKISALAKGARRPKNPFEAAIDLLTLCRIVFLHKTSDALDLLTEAKLVRRFRNRQNDLEKLYAGYYFAELLTSLTEDSDPNPLLFDLANDSLAKLESNTALGSVVLRFELTMLHLLGMMPSLHACVQCQTSRSQIHYAKGRNAPQRIAFGLNAGGILCEECRKGKRGIISTRIETLDLLSRFAEHDPLQSRIDLDSTEAVDGELRGLMNQYFAGLLGKRPRTSKFLSLLGG